MNKESIIIESVFDSEVSLVWKAITDKDMMKQWYIDVEAFVPTIGFEFEFWGGEPGEEKWKHLCVITEVIPEEKLSYSWKYQGYTGSSILSFELSKIDKNTKLKLTHSGIDTFPKDVPELAIENFKAGWTQAIHVSLKDFLEKN